MVLIKNKKPVQKLGMLLILFWLTGCGNGGLFTKSTDTPSPVPTMTLTSTMTPWPSLTPIIVPPATITPAVSPTSPPVAVNALRLSMGLGSVITIDPSLVEINNYANGLQIVEETTVGLTRINEVTSRVEAGMAKSWEVSADGLSYTFHLYDNVPWVKWDSLSNQVLPVSDCNGFTRLVTAHDFQYGILRTLSPTVHSETAYLLTGSILGAEEYHQGVVDADFVHVKAIDDFTLKIDFIQPGSYYPTLIGLALAHAQPSWLIAGDDCNPGVGDRWTNIEFYQSYGPYVLTEYDPSVQLTLLNNPYWIGTEIIPQPKIDTLRWAWMPSNQALSDYSNAKLDVIEVPQGEVPGIQENPVLSKEIISAPTLCTYYYAFNSKAPFVKDAHLRRSMTMAIDRKQLLGEIYKGINMVAGWFSAPGVVAAPTPEEFPDFGVVFDPSIAKKEFDDYLRQTGQSPAQVDITLTFNRGEIHRQIAEEIQRMWKDILGLQVKLNEVDGKNYQDLVNGSSSPQLWRNSYCYNYQDANNFIGDVFAIGGTANPNYGGINYFNPAFQDAIHQATIHNDLLIRTRDFAQAEQILNVQDAVVIPLFWYQQYGLTKPYVNRTISQIGGIERFEKWSWR